MKTKMLFVLLILFITGCSGKPDPIVHYNCDSRDFSGIYNPDKNEFTFYFSAEGLNNIESEKTFKVVEDSKLTSFIDDYELKDGQYFVALESVDEDDPVTPVFAVTTDDYLYFRTPYFSKVVDYQAEEPNNNFYYFVMPCVSENAYADQVQ